MDEFLQEDDEARQRVDAYRMQIAELHRWLSPTLVEPVPERLLEALRSATAGHATAEPMSASV